jgi:integrase
MRLTDSIIRDLPAYRSPDDRKRNYELYPDDACPGLLVRVTTTGAKSFVLAYRTTSGRKRRYTIGSTKTWTIGGARDEARELRKRIRSEGFDPLASLKADREAPTVADLCEKFIEVHLPKLRESSRRNCLSGIEREVLPAMRHLKVADVTHADCDALHRKITKRGAKYSANRTASLLHKMFAMAVRWRWRLDNPATGIQKNQEEKRRRYLLPDELARLTAALGRMDDRLAAAIIRILLLTGARSHEVLSMQWDQVNIETRTWTKPGHTTKQKMEHQVPLSPAVLQILSGIKKSESEFVFPGTGKTKHRESIRKPWAKLLRDAKITDLRVHDLRHSFASISASHGASLHVIGALLGHTQAATTHRYAHLMDAPLRAVTERVAAVVEGGKSAEVKPLRKRR